MLVAFDLEGTLLDAELFPEIGRHYGRGASLEEITDRGMNGELGFEESLLRRVRMVRGLPIKPIRELCLQLPINRGAQDAVSELKGFGLHPRHSQRRI